MACMEKGKNRLNKKQKRHRFCLRVRVRVRVGLLTAGRWLLLCGAEGRGIFKRAGPIDPPFLALSHTASPLPDVAQDHNTDHSHALVPLPHTQAGTRRPPFPPRHAHDARVFVITSSIIMLLQSPTIASSRRGRGRSPASLLLAGLCLLGLFLGGQGAEDYYKILVRARLVWREGGRGVDQGKRGRREMMHTNECTSVGRPAAV